MPWFRSPWLHKALGRRIDSEVVSLDYEINSKIEALDSKISALEAHSRKKELPERANPFPMLSDLLRRIVALEIRVEILSDFRQDFLKETEEFEREQMFQELPIPQDEP